LTSANSAPPPGRGFFSTVKSSQIGTCEPLRRFSVSALRRHPPVRLERHRPASSSPGEAGFRWHRIGHAAIKREGLACGVDRCRREGHG